MTRICSVVYVYELDCSSENLCTDIKMLCLYTNSLLFLIFLMLQSVHLLSKMLIGVNVRSEKIEFMKRRV